MKNFSGKTISKIYWFKERNKEELFIVLIIIVVILFQFLFSPSGDHETNWEDEYNQIQFEENINI